jgi:hypothetical protein
VIEADEIFGGVNRGEEASTFDTVDVAQFIDNYNSNPQDNKSAIDALIDSITQEESGYADTTFEFQSLEKLKELSFTGHEYKLNVYPFSVYKDANGENAAFMYKYNGTGAQGDDVYFTVSVDGVNYTFLVRNYLTGKDTDVYKAAEALEIGKTYDMEGYLYWYNGPNPYITSIKAN